MFVKQLTINGFYIKWTGEIYNDDSDDIVEDSEGQTYMDFETTPPLPLF